MIYRRRERGRIPVKGVRLVETATVNGEGGDPFAPDGYPFQVGYCESSDDQSQRTVPQYTLYLVANTEKERSDWIYAIRQGAMEEEDVQTGFTFAIDEFKYETRQVCEDTNTPKSFRFHPGLWSGKRWSCCKSISRATFGCQAATHWRETNNNPISPSSSLLSSLSSLSSSSSSFVAVLNYWLRVKDDNSKGTTRFVTNCFNKSLGLFRYAT
uniref:PH domain-containing protein n=1 Tax=Glossina pallidipes TaxID=7398 RepID=A0A1B0AEN0_GLOPL